MKLIAQGFTRQHGIPTLFSETLPLIHCTVNCCVYTQTSPRLLHANRRQNVGDIEDIAGSNIQEHAGLLYNSIQI